MNTEMDNKTADILSDIDFGFHIFLFFYNIFMWFYYYKNKNVIIPLFKENIKYYYKGNRLSIHHKTGRDSITELVKTKLLNDKIKIYLQDGTIMEIDCLYDNTTNHYNIDVEKLKGKKFKFNKNDINYDYIPFTMDDLSNELGDKLNLLEKNQQESKLELKERLQSINEKNKIIKNNLDDIKQKEENIENLVITTRSDKEEIIEKLNFIIEKHNKMTLICNEILISINRTNFETLSNALRNLEQHIKNSTQQQKVNK